MAVGLLLLMVLLATLGFLLYRRHRRKLDESYARLLARDGLLPTARPAGRGPRELHRLRACPRGDRRSGIEHGVTGEVELRLGDETLTVGCAAFVWWWEEERRHHNDKGAVSRSYARRERTVGVVSVPHRLPAISIAPEGLLTRLGVGGRRDFQVESEEFNRRFDVRVADKELAIRLVDAGFQGFLLELFADRHIEFDGDAVLLAGDPVGRDGDLYDDIAALPGARRDVQLLVSRVPDSFWRALRHRDRRLTGEAPG